MSDLNARFGRYEIIDEIGRGAMGRVYRARDPLIDRTVAVKAILASGAEETEAFRARFRQEAQAAGRLAHPGIVTIYDVGEQDDTHTPFIVMEFVAGRTLSAAVNDAGPPLSLDTRLDLISQVADALDCAHRAGIVHRDIKPANILVTPEGRAKIADFGVAKSSLTQAQVTVAGSMLGTPSYMSPEQVEGKPADGRSDLFSLGVILYWILTDHLPFDGESTGEILFKVMSRGHAQPSTLNPAFSPEFDRVVARALAKNPDDRYQSGRELHDDIESLRAGREVRWAGSAPVPASAVAPVPAATEAGIPLGWITNPALAAASSAETTLVDPPLARRARDTAVGVHRAWKWTLAPAAAVVLVVGMSLSLGMTMARTATLKLALSGQLPSGKVTVWMDERTIASGTVESRTVAGIRPSAVGSYYHELRVPPGPHRIRVMVVGTNNPYDETRQVEATLQSGGTYALYMQCGQRRDTGTLDLKLYRLAAGTP